MIQHIKDLTPDPKNARRHTPRNVGMLEQALNEVGAARSIVIDDDGVVLAGNATIEAAAQAGITKVQVVEGDGETLIAVRRRGLTPEQKTKLALYDNRVAELAEWEPDVLSSLAQEFDLSGMFFDEELSDILASVEETQEGGGGDDFDATPEDGPTRTQVGDLWVIGGVHRLVVGDCTDPANVVRLMGGERAQAMVSDSPYGIEQEGIENDDAAGLPKLFAGCLACLPIDDGVVVNFQSTRMFPAWLDAIRQAGHKFERMLWMYKSNDITFPWRGWLLKSECMLVSTIGRGEWFDVHPYAHDCYVADWNADNKLDIDGWHASIKPFTVILDLVQRVCPPQALIYEPFAGSGTTLVAAHRTSRRAYLMEISPRYADVILRRAEAEGLSVERVDG